MLQTATICYQCYHKVVVCLDLLLLHILWWLVFCIISNVLISYAVSNDSNFTPEVEGHAMLAVDWNTKVADVDRGQCRISLQCWHHTGHWWSTAGVRLPWAIFSSTDAAGWSAGLRCYCDRHMSLLCCWRMHRAGWLSGPWPTFQMAAGWTAHPASWTARGGGMPMPCCRAVLTGWPVATEAPDFWFSASWTSLALLNRPQLDCPW